MVKPCRSACEVEYPADMLTPEDFLGFIYTKPFDAEWKNLNLNSDEDLLALEIGIAACPEGGDIIPGTGGLRKLRVSPPGWKKGKRDALRVCYVYFPEHSVVVMAIVYSKSDRVNLSSKDKKNMKKFIKSLEESLSNGNFS